MIIQPNFQEAIYSAYSDAVSILGNDANSAVVTDANGNTITIDPAVVSAKLASLQSDYALAKVKEKAQSLLQATDWATLSDVTTGSPKLTNQSDFLTYRNALRSIAVNPIDNPVWPTLPSEQWSN